MLCEEAVVAGWLELYWIQQQIHSMSLSRQSSFKVTHFTYKICVFLKAEGQKQAITFKGPETEWKMIIKHKICFTQMLLTCKNQV